MIIALSLLLFLTYFFYKRHIFTPEYDLESLIAIHSYKYWNSWRTSYQSNTHTHCKEHIHY